MRQDSTREATDTAATSEDERVLVDRLLSGDEGTFARLVERHYASMARMARVYVHDAAVAEEVVQETWLAVLEGLPGFEARSSLKTWMFRILRNRAMSRREREWRSVPFSALLDSARQPSEPSVDPARFFPRESEHPGRWAIPPSPWPDPEQRLLSKETVERVREAIDGLAPAQREVIVLRDVEGWSSREVCNFLGLSETNQRVLLHRARTKVRQALDGYLQESEPSERRRA